MQRLNSYRVNILNILLYNFRYVIKSGRELGDFFTFDKLFNVHHKSKIVHIDITLLLALSFFVENIKKVWKNTMSMNLNSSIYDLK